MCMTRHTTLLTTNLEEVKTQPRVKSFLERKNRNSPNSAASYLRGLVTLQEFLNSDNEAQEQHHSAEVTSADKQKKIKVNDLADLFSNGNERKVYDFIDRFISFLVSSRKLSVNSIRLYVAATKSYLENCDVEINSTRFKNKVTIPKIYKEDEAPIDDSDIRKMLLSCSNRRLKTYLLCLASGGFRAVELLALRLKDIDFSTIPTKIHVRKEFSKLKTARDVYISEEATTYLKQFIAWKYRAFKRKSQTRIRNEDDLVFAIRRDKKATDPQHIYFKMLVEFQKLLTIVGLDKRKDGMIRRIVTFHSFRRFCKTVLANNTSTDYSEWFLGHSKSPYFVQKESERRLLYATKCMPFLTFTDYSRLEQDSTIKQTEVEMLMMKDANKDREIELLKQRISVKDKEIDMLKQRDIVHLDSMTLLSDQLQNVMQRVKELEDNKK
jgi:integrase